MPKKLTQEQFILKARQVHGWKYDYSLVKYTNGRTHVCIICPKHGMFEQLPNSHLNGHGCSKCKAESASTFHKSTLEEFIQKSILVHGDKYNYELVDYKSNAVEVSIICPKHGVFTQKPRAHTSGNGCPHCFRSRGEELIATWLNNEKIDYEFQYWVYPQQVLFGTKRFRVDFFIPSLNTIIEYNGVQHYKKIDYWHKDEDGFADQQDRDRRLREYCKQHKIRLVEIPYTEFDNIDKILTRKLLKFKKNK